MGGGTPLYEFQSPLKRGKAQTLTGCDIALTWWFQSPLKRGKAQTANSKDAIVWPFQSPLKRGKAQTG